MKTLTFLTRMIISIFFIIIQHAFVFGLGLIVYAQTSEVLGIAVWLLSIPMIYINYKTYKHIMRHGVIKFMTMNADTSDIDVAKGKRLYDED
jgi:hypothetical protein